MNELTSILRDGKHGNIQFFSLGKTWTMPPIEWAIGQQFSEWMVMEAKVRIFRQRDRLEEETRVENARRRTERRPLVDLYREALDSVDRRVERFEFEWGNEACNAAVMTETGLTHLLYISLGIHHPNMTPELAGQILTDNPQEIGSVVRQALVAGDPKRWASLAEKPAGEANNNGNRETAVTASAG